MKFMHIADCHVGNRQYKMEERERDFERSFAGAVGAALAEKAQNGLDAIVVAGDLFDNPRPNSDNVSAVQAAVSKALAADIRVVGVEGNHDQVYDGDWLKVCGIEALDCAADENSTSPRKYVKIGNAVVSGSPYRRADELESVLDDMAEYCRRTNLRVDVFVMHVGLAEMGDSHAADTTVQAILPKLRDMGVRYVAMGHIHIPAEQVHDGIWFVQPGSTEVCAIDEAKEKLAKLAEVSPGVAVSISDIPLRTRPFVMKMVETTPEMDELLNDLDAGKFDGMFVDVYVSSKVDNGMQRLEAFRRRGVLHKAHDFGTADPEKRVIDRKKTFGSLEEIVDEDYPPGSDENALIKKIMSMPPENAVPEAQKYRDGGLSADTESNTEEKKED